MAAYCATCDLVATMPFSAVVLDISWTGPDGAPGRSLVPAGQSAIECGGCGQLREVINAIEVPNTQGAVTVFGLSPEEREAAIAFAHEIAADHDATPEAVADELARRVPGLSRLAEQIRNEPLAAVGVGTGLASLILQVVTSLGPESDPAPQPEPTPSTSTTPSVHPSSDVTPGP